MGLYFWVVLITIAAPFHSSLSLPLTSSEPGSQPFLLACLIFLREALLSFFSAFQMYDTWMKLTMERYLSLAANVVFLPFSHELTQDLKGSSRTMKHNVTLPCRQPQGKLSWWCAIGAILGWIDDQDPTVLKAKVKSKPVCDSNRMIAEIKFQGPFLKGKRQGI